MATINVLGIEGDIERLEEEVNEQLSTGLREDALQTLADLKVATPVDTGRARNSWTVSVDAVSYDIEDGDVPSPQTTNPTGNPPLELFLTNGVPYIRGLNEGNSQQAPSRFIETIVSRYFDGTVNVDYGE